MSRKKAVKGRAPSSKSPKASPRSGRSLAVAAAPSSGLVYPSRPSLSNSGEFYDIAFKVSPRAVCREAVGTLEVTARVPNQRKFD